MPFVNGVFQRVYNWVNDKNASIDITASRFDTEDDGFATGLSTAILKDGTQTVTANIPFAAFKITGLGSGSARTDSVNLGQVEDGTVNWVAAAGSADAITAAYTPAITVLVDGQLCFFRATAANATTTPTFSPNGLTARTITKQGGTALAARDIPAANAEIPLRYNLANTRWELLSPTTVKQMLSGGSQTAVNAASTVFAGINTASGVAEFTVQVPIPFACTLRNFFVRASGQPVGAETFTYTARMQGADTALTCSMTGATTTASDTTHSVAATAGQNLSIKIVTSAGAAVVVHNWSLEIDPA